MRLRMRLRLMFHLMVASVLRGRTGLWTRELRVLSQGSLRWKGRRAPAERTSAVRLIQLCEAYLIIGNI